MLNRVSLVGRLTKDPEIRYTADNQTPVAKFTIAVDRTFKREGQQAADFIPIVVFGKAAENCGRYIKKGRMVAVSGKIQTRSWDDPESKRHYATEVVADEVDFLDKPGEDGGEDFHPVDNEDELPF